MTWRGTTSVRDRIFSSLPYLLPLIDSLIFARSFFQVFPQLTLLFVPLVPVLAIYSIPFVSLILFFALFLLVVRNERIPHIIRFNTMQALLVDIILILFRLILQVVGGVAGLAFILKTISTSLFLGVAAIFIYSVVQSLRGRYAEIPTLSDAVYMQVR